MQRIREYIERLVPLSDDEWSKFSSIIEISLVRKKEIIVEEGKVCDFIAFIGEGSFRFYYNNDGTEQVTAFFFENEFVSNYRSVLTGKPSTHYIQALSDSTIYKFGIKDLNNLYNEYKIFERFGRLIAEQLYLSISSRLDTFLNETPEERYRELFNRNPRFIQEIPQYMIASYLGVKPETLSRIRARM